jgi:hypothetical protein
MGGRTFEAEPDVMYLGFLLPPDSAVTAISGTLAGAEDLAKAATSRMAAGTGSPGEEGVALLVVDGLAALAAKPGGAAIIAEVSAKIAAFLSVQRLTQRHAPLAGVMQNKRAPAAP